MTGHSRTNIRSKTGARTRTRIRTRTTTSARGIARATPPPPALPPEPKMSAQHCLETGGWDPTAVLPWQPPQQLLHSLPFSPCHGGLAAGEHGQWQQKGPGTRHPPSPDPHPNHPVTPAILPNPCLSPLEGHLPLVWGRAALSVGVFVLSV